MKTYILFFIVFILLASCNKRDFEGIRADVKIEKQRQEISKQLITSKNGWIGYLYPAGGTAYTFKFNFDQNNRVKTFASISLETSSKAIESSYRISADQVVSLFFDTYTYLHQLADPDEKKSGGSRGIGRVSDFEFSILKSTKDTIFLKGNHNGSEMQLIRASENEGDDFIKNAFNRNQELEALNQFKFYYHKIVISNKIYGIIINNIANSLAIYYEENGKFKSFQTEYALTSNGIVLKKPIEIDPIIISSFQNFKIQKELNTATCSINGKMEAKITNENTPISIDSDAPRRMYLLRKIHFSKTGFTIDGKPDGFNLMEIPNFEGVVYFPRRYIDPLDAFYVLYNNGSNYVGPLFNTRYNDRGVMTFNKTHEITGQNPGDQFLPKLRNQSSQLFSHEGFYVFQTGTNSYDFVSVRNGNTWIRFN